MSTEIDGERQRRVLALRQVDRRELLAMQPSLTEEVKIANETVIFTTYVESQQDGRILVLVRSDQPGLWGLVTYGGTDGFWMRNDGLIAEASDNDVLEFFG